MILYFIANENLIEKEYNILSKILVTNDDKIIRFNNGRDINLFNGRCDILYSRCDSNRCQGFVENKHKHDLLNLSKTDFYKISKSSFKYNKQLLDDNENINIKEELNIYDFKIPGGEATTGYIGFMNTINIYKNYDKIYLINFDFYKSRIYQGKPNWDCKTTGHNFKYEYEYFERLSKENENIIWLKKDESDKWEELI